MMFLLALSDLEKENCDIRVVRVCSKHEQAKRKQDWMRKKSSSKHGCIEMHKVLMAYRGNPIFSIVDPPARIGASQQNSS